jgi:hypothetical protein
MLKLFKRSLGAAAVLALGLGTMSMSLVDGEAGGRIKVYLQNKCSSDAKFKVASPGSSTHYTVDDGSKKPMTFMEGTKIYDTDGNLVHTVSSSSEGKTVVVCD